MKRFYVHPDRITRSAATLDAGQVKRLARVLRLRPGDYVVIFDGRFEYLGRIEVIGPKEAKVKLEEKLGTPGEPRLELWLAPGLIKGPRMDTIMEKAAELGVRRIMPVHMARSVTKTSKGSTQRIARWRKIVQSAAAQSGRKDVPHIEDPCDFEEILHKNADLKVFLWERLGGDGVREQPWERINGRRPPRTVILMTGPEGGFTGEEVEMATNNGWVAWGLGSLVLRAETACIAGTAILTHRLAGGLL